VPAAYEVIGLDMLFHEESDKYLIPEDGVYFKRKSSSGFTAARFHQEHY